MSESPGPVVAADRKDCPGGQWRRVAWLALPFAVVLGVLYWGILRDLAWQWWDDAGIDVYAGQARVVATFPRGTLKESPDIRATVRTQACSNEVCLPEATFHVTVPPVPVPR